MNPAIKRVVLYMAIAAACWFLAVAFAAEGPAFIAIFGTGLVIAAVAEVLLWTHVLRQTSRRFRRRQHAK